MNLDAYDKTFELENRYWWYLGRRHIFVKLLEKYASQTKNLNLVDIGCGTGGNLIAFAKFGKVLGLDIEPRALEYCRQKGLNNVALMKGIYETGLEDSFADVVTLLDVLEHFDDDTKALRELHRILKPNGLILINVPAFKILWSELDIALHHFRRYRRRELEELLQKNGFEIVKSSYIFFFVFPLIFTFRVIGKFKERRFHPQFTYVEFPNFVNNILILFSKIEAVLLKFLRLPVGSSVLVIAKKTV